MSSKLVPCDISNLQKEKKKKEEKKVNGTGKDNRNFTTKILFGNAFEPAFSKNLIIFC